VARNFIVQLDAPAFGWNAHARQEPALIVIAAFVCSRPGVCRYGP
jgi:hypothetical protein